MNPREDQRRLVKLIVGSGLLVAAITAIVTGFFLAWPLVVVGSVLLIIGLLLLTGSQFLLRMIRITGGIVMMLVGIILSIPGVPGPGFVLIFVGLSILAVDFVW